MKILIIFAGILLMALFLGLNKSRTARKEKYKDKYEEEILSAYDDDPLKELKQQEERENYIFENEC